MRVDAARFVDAFFHTCDSAEEALERLAKKGSLGNRFEIGIGEALCYAAKVAQLALRALPPEEESRMPGLTELRVETQKQQLQAISASSPAVWRRALVFWLRQDVKDAVSAARPFFVELGSDEVQEKGPSRVLTAKAAELRLASGQVMPMLGFGTGIFHVPRATLPDVILEACRLGYRHFDCAQNYGTEAAVGEGLARSGIPRQEFFLSSKLSRPSALGREATRRLVEEELQNLRTEYLDLYLWHCPFMDCQVSRSGSVSNSSKDSKERKNSSSKPTNLPSINRRHSAPEVSSSDTSEVKVLTRSDAAKESWRELEKLVEEGKIRSLGVSNHSPGQLDQVCRFARVQPLVNQLKFDVFRPGYQHPKPGLEDPLHACKHRGVQVVGYSTLSGWPLLLRAVQDPLVLALAKELNRSAGQILLRHAIQKGIGVIPASASSERMAENLGALDFELGTRDMALLDGLAHLSSRHPGVPSWLKDTYALKTGKAKEPLQA